LNLFGEAAMNNNRRRALKSGAGVTVMGLAAAVGLLPASNVWAQAWNKAAFDGKNLADVVKALGGAAAVPSTDISINAPDIAENGAVVPIGVTSKLGKTESIAILVEKNPSALAASFDIPGGTEAGVTTRVKMGQSSNIHALVKADGKYYVATKEVKVTLGGCGG
jgi:sulfur-oxidizing protein SoxY